MKRGSIVPKDPYRISSFKHHSVYLISGLLGTAFIRGQHL